MMAVLLTCSVRITYERTAQSVPERPLMSFLCSLRLDALLSFRPGSDPIALTPLNVLIGPNGSGKSNLIEAIELLHATPTAFAAAIRDGGGAAEWLWKGERGSSKKAATIDAI